ncbi:YfhO family protein [Paenibacillus algorifonticola]|uniref:YfhO family protein n=1 Tax=Paenibacillus algorifonticola TaxID=684063 RepID=UPI003D2CA96F
MYTKLRHFYQAYNRDVVVIMLYAVISCLMYFNMFNSSGFLAPGDGIVSYVPLKKFYAEALHNLHIPLWNSNLSLGMPFLADVQTSVFYPPNLIYAILPFNTAYNFSFLLCLTLAGSFTYLYLRSIKLSRRAAFVGGLAFMFSAAINGRKGQVTIRDAVIWLPLILYYYEMLINKRKKIYLVLMSLAFAVQFFAGFTQVSFYTAMVLGVYFLFSLKRYPNMKQWLLDKINFLFIAIGLIAIQLLPTIFLTRYVGRESIIYEFFAGFSLPLKSLITFFFPYFYGNDTPYVPYPIYKNQNIFSDNWSFGVYVGLITAIMALILIFTKVKSSRKVLIWTTIMVVSLVLALGDSFPLINKIMYHVPLYNAFRVSARFNFAFDLAIAVLFAMQIHRILEKPERVIKLKKYILYTSGIILVWAIATAGVYILCPPDGMNKDIIVSNFSLKNSSIIIPIVLLIVYNLILFVYLKIKRKAIIQIVFSVVLLLDLHSYSFYYANAFQTDKNETIAKEVRDLIKPDERAWAVFDRYVGNGDFGGMIPNRNMFYGISSINGYATFLSNDYKSLLGFDERGVNIQSPVLLSNNYILSALNVKYIIANNDKEDLINNSSFFDVDNRIEVANISNKKIEYIEEAGYGIHQEIVKLRPNNYYNISFRLKENSSKNLYVDFAGENYIGDAQQLKVSNTESNTYSQIFHFGSNIPKEVYIRIVSLDKSPLLVDQLTVEMLPKLENTAPSYENIFQDENYTIYKNNHSLDKFYAVQNTVNSDDLKGDLYSTNLLTTAIVGDYPQRSNMNLPSIKLLEYSDGYGKAEIESKDAASFVVFSEQYYPGWKASIDGKETAIHKVNGLTQGIEVPAGKHTIEFSYEPKEFKLAIYILLFTLIYIFVYVNFDKVRFNKKSKS